MIEPQRLATGSIRDAVIYPQTALEMFLAHVPVRAIYDRTTNAKPEAIRKSLKRRRRGYWLARARRNRSQATKPIAKG